MDVSSLNSTLATLRGYLDKVKHLETLLFGNMAMDLWRP